MLNLPAGASSQQQQEQPAIDAELKGIWDPSQMLLEGMSQEDQDLFKKAAAEGMEKKEEVDEKNIDPFKMTDEERLNYALAESTKTAEAAAAAPVNEDEEDEMLRRAIEESRSEYDALEVSRRFEQDLFDQNGNTMGEGDSAVESQKLNR